MEQFFTLEVVGFASIVGYILGMIWYAPVLFIKWHQTEEGMTQEKVSLNNKMYVVKVLAASLVLHGILAVTLSLMLSLLAPQTLGMALAFSSFLSVGIIVITRFIDLVYSTSGTFNSMPNQKKFLLSSLYYILLFAVMTIVMYYVS